MKVQNPIEKSLKEAIL